ncbi:hypothetical protein HBH98_082540 [Parastagonospora nodorum]|nr:hypothetical protein HBH51_088830 [Parastagonospora nodorum]KAH3978359.1 hypothetical protein HBH52_103920 [Parastagonospora nodorum]KAH4035436.1 hypothetical protein HBI09_086850 [Parastagonospora nodorum]KAH4122193.1 hypothetical protein HBH47_091730 [Parastagonospora nodorum]KAH4190703.1 hypothetical protein HBH42_132510 [Parastagonospora nodorum]
MSETRNSRSLFDLSFQAGVMYRPNITAVSCASFLALYVSATIGVLNLAKVVPADFRDYLFSQSHATWSREPYCTSHGREFCVYTSNITKTHSLSMIFSPEDAEKVAKAVELASNTWQDQAEQPRAWQVVDIPSKDKGVIATRNMGKYETIMVDHAAVVMDVDVSEVWSSRLLRVAIDRLQLPNTIRALGASEGDGPLEQRVMKTNGFGKTIAGVGTKALFPLASRINHACRPNAYVLFCPTSGLTMAIRASRAIKIGEEITISYLPVGLSSHDRKTLLQPWGFTCHCALCDSSPLTKRASDIRRILIGQSEAKILECAATGRVDEAIRLAEETVGLITDEGLESMLTDE